MEAGVFIVLSAGQNCADMKKMVSLCRLLQKSNYRSCTIAIVEHVLLLASWLPFAQFVPNVNGLRAFACVCVFVSVHVLEWGQPPNKVTTEFQKCSTVDESRLVAATTCFLSIWRKEWITGC